MRRMLPALLACALLSTPIFAKEQESRPGVGVLGYLKDRGHDLLDIFRVRGGIPQKGKGLGVKAKVTSLAQVGYVQFRGDMYGLERRAIGITRERRSEGGLSLLYGSIHESEYVTGNDFLKADTLWSLVKDRRILKNNPYWDDGRRRFLGVGAEVATPIGAIDLGLYPEEALDFVTSWFGIDLYDDDEQGLRDANHHPVATTPRTPDPSAPFAEKRARLEAFDEAVNSPSAAPTTESPAPPADAGIKAQEADAAIRELNRKAAKP